MGWWMAGLALAALVWWAVRDAGRPGRASGPALATLHAVGGLGLTAMAVHALLGGAPWAALVAATAAGPLVAGLVGGLLRPRVLVRTGEPRARPPGRTPQGAEPRRIGDSRAA
jgi:hypothetical protein